MKQSQTFGVSFAVQIIEDRHWQAANSPEMDPELCRGLLIAVDAGGVVAALGQSADLCGHGAALDRRFFPVCQAAIDPP